MYMAGQIFLLKLLKEARDKYSTDKADIINRVNKIAKTNRTMTLTKDLSSMM